VRTSLKYEFVRKRGRLIGWTLSLALCLLSHVPSAADPQPDVQVKAAYLARLAPFVVWPATLFAGPNVPLTLCVQGADPFGPALDQMTSGQGVGSHPIIVRRVERLDADSGCQIAYLGGSPAQSQAAALKAVDGKPVSTWTELTNRIVTHQAGSPVAFTIQRDGKQFTKNITLATLTWRKGGFLGVEETPFVSVSPVTAVESTGQQFGQVVTSSVQGLAKLPSEIPKLFSANRAKSGGGVSSVVGVSEATGQVVSAAGVSWQEKVAFVLLVVASVNIFVGLFNLLPFLPLDGGKLAIVIFEAIRSAFARLRRKPDPGPIDMQKLIPLSVGFLFVFVCLGVLLIAADIFNPIRLQ